MAEELEKTAAQQTSGSEATIDGGADLSTLLGGLLGGERGAGSMSGDPLAGIGAVLQDPQMMAKLPEVMAMLRPMMGQLTGGASPDHAATATDVPAAAKPTEERSLSHHSGGSGCRERRVALLCALRPYLSPRRQEAIDYILRMDKMGKLFRNG